MSVPEQRERRPSKRARSPREAGERRWAILITVVAPIVVFWTVALLTGGDLLLMFLITAAVGVALGLVDRFWAAPRRRAGQAAARTGRRS
jgi:hypothetical protein